MPRGEWWKTPRGTTIGGSERKAQSCPETVGADLADIRTRNRVIGQVGTLGLAVAIIDRQADGARQSDLDARAQLPCQPCLALAVQFEPGNAEAATGIRR